MRKLVFISMMAVIGVAILACGTGSTELTEDAGSYVTQTTAAGTAESALTPISGSPTENTATQTSTAPVYSEKAPDPLPATHTGIILNNGECFDFDTGAITTLDANCDVLLAEPALLRQVNLAQVSGYVTMTVPTHSSCAAAMFDPNDLVVQTDLFYCLITNLGNVGFLVPRSYVGGVPATGITFDYWIFP